MNGSFQEVVWSGMREPSLTRIRDVNECLVKNGGCHQTCINFDGSYRCDCTNGYQLAPDMSTCVGK